jgi:leucyl/phenylalanyl-tRNA--protein transferase
MPIFRLSEKIEFPPPCFARSDGLLCIGGDLSSQRLLLAYQNGIFPWFSQSEPLLWWSPDPRLVILPQNIYISKSLTKKIKKQVFTIKIDTAFERTIRACAGPRFNRPEEEGTWLVDEMIESYTRLHELGYAHSIETWREDKLVGGLYGISLGGSFFGESMFSLEADASKLALVALATHLGKHKFDLIDCQVTSNHLVSMGAEEISRDSFLAIIEKSVKRKDIENIWNQDINLGIN